jgi:hypothetical protein
MLTATSPAIPRGRCESVAQRARPNKDPDVHQPPRRGDEPTSLYAISIAGRQVHRSDRTGNSCLVSSPRGAARPRTVFIVGNGAIVDQRQQPAGWRVAEGLKERELFFPCDEPERLRHYCQLSPEVILAHATMCTRTCTNALLAEFLSGQRSGLPHLDSLRRIRRFRSEVAALFRRALSSEKLQLAALPAGLEELLRAGDTGAITVNWDEVVWRQTDLRHKIQLHGTCRRPSTMLFPTEYVNEELGPFNAIAFLREHLAERSLGARQEEFAAFAALFHDMRGQSMSDLIVAHQTALEWIRTAHRLVFWGVALNSYDSELCAIFFEAADGGGRLASEKQIAVVNPSRDALERTAGLLRVATSEIEYFAP